MSMQQADRAYVSSLIPCRVIDDRVARTNIRLY